jgi:hypothetical protein
MSSDRYEEMREKIPLYLNGRLSEEEARVLEEFIQQHPEITDEMEDFAEIRDYLKDTSDIELPDQERVFRMIMERVREEESFSRPERISVFERIREFFSAPLVPWAVVAVQLLLIFFLVTAPYRNNEYRTLTSPVSRTEIMLNIVFNPDAREVDIRGLLNSIGATIVSGPDENGLYIIKVDGKEIDNILKTLRNSRLIRFVEKRI